MPEDFLDEIVHERGPDFPAKVDQALERRGGHYHHGDARAVEMTGFADYDYPTGPGSIAVGRFTGDLADGVKLDLLGRHGLPVAGVFLTVQQADQLAALLDLAVSQKDTL